MATIVVGVDPSTAGRKALAFALREAVVRGAEVVARGDATVEVR